MKCTECGAINKHPRFFHIFADLPLGITAEEGAKPVATEAPVQWACWQCGCEHLRDGTPFRAAAQREEPGD